MSHVHIAWTSYLPLGVLWHLNVPNNQTGFIRVQSRWLTVQFDRSCLLHLMKHVVHHHHPFSTFLFSSEFLMFPPHSKCNIYIPNYSQHKISMLYRIPSRQNCNFYEFPQHNSLTNVWRGWRITDKRREACQSYLTDLGKKWKKAWHRV